MTENRIEDGVHKVDKTEPIQSIEGRRACYVKGRCFHADVDQISQGEKVIVEDGSVKAKIEPLPEIDEGDI